MVAQGGGDPALQAVIQTAEFPGIAGFDGGDFCRPDQRRQRQAGARQLVDGTSEGQARFSALVIIATSVRIILTENRASSEARRA